MAPEAPPELGVFDPKLKPDMLEMSSGAIGWMWNAIGCEAKRVRDALVRWKSGDERCRMGFV